MTLYIPDHVSTVTFEVLGFVYSLNKFIVSFIVSPII